MQRYVLAEQLAAEREFLPNTAWWQFSPKFNVAPGQYVPAIRLHEGQSEGVMLRWGLIPSWVEGDPAAHTRSVVHANRVTGATGTRSSWLAGRRCILPLSGFYTWQLTSSNYRQPYFVRLVDRAVFGMAGIWDRWVSEADDVIEGCAILRVPANKLVSELAGPAQGMPAILRRRDYAEWLHGAPLTALGAIGSYNTQLMHAYPVSPRINSLSPDDSALIRMAG